MTDLKENCCSVEKMCAFFQKMQKRTLRRDAFRVWSMFVVDMTTEKRLCKIVQQKKLRMLCREVFRAWRLGEKNQIEALETEIETLNERVRVLEEQKTRPLDIGYIASELAKGVCLFPMRVRLYRRQQRCSRAWSLMRRVLLPGSLLEIPLLRKRQVRRRRLWLKRNKS